jgi:hypothetical protein
MTTKAAPYDVTQLERHQICATGLIGDAALRKYLRNDPNVRALTKHRLRAAVEQLGLQAKFPGLFDSQLGAAADPNRGEVVDEEEGDAATSAI